MDKIYSVLEINNYIKFKLDDDFRLSQVLVRGEISNHKHDRSGHHYFKLKDDGGVISAVMFKSDAINCNLNLCDGMQIIAFGRISSFVKTGQYQLYVNSIEADGIGKLHIEYENLKNKLYKEGLFNQEHKKELPRFPEKIAIVTAKNGAAIQDMLKILENRYKLAEIFVYPVKVQGEGAETEIANAINYINNLDLVDVIIIGRGGGSIEDLWAFNDEILAHTIFASNIPIISAVGHEPDYTISDFVADVRASTPSNASEIVVPDTVNIRAFLNNAQNILDNLIINEINDKKTQVLKLSNRILSPKRYIDEKRVYINYLSSKMKDPQILVDNYRRKVENFDKTIDNRYKMILSQKRHKTIGLMTYIDGYSPMKVLSRGFGYSLDDNKKIVKSVKKLKVAQEITTKYSDGIVKSKVIEIEVDKNGNI
ncbi:MAG: exodeoxyribonuclease VII large subunit [Clostridia bacterium]